MACASAAAVCCFCVSITSSLRCRKHRTRLCCSGDGLLAVSLGLLETLHRGVLVRREMLIAHDVELRPCYLGVRGPNVGLGLRDHRLLKSPCRVEVCKRGLLSGNPCPRFCKTGAVIAVVDLDQQIARVHPLVVGDGNLGDKAGDLWRDRRHFAPDIGVISALDEAPGRPPFMGVPRPTYSDQQRERAAGYIL